MTAPARPFRWTREEYYRLGDLGLFHDRRVELIRGQIVEHDRPSWPHELSRAETAERLQRVFAGTGWVSQRGPLPSSDSDPEPDVAVYPGTVRDYTDHPTNPLLVVEVADTSLAYDTTTKVELYAEAGHPEYWVLDLPNRRLLVFRDPYPIPAGGHRLSHPPDLRPGRHGVAAGPPRGRRAGRRPPAVEWGHPGGP